MKPLNWSRLTLPARWCCQWVVYRAQFRGWWKQLAPRERGLLAIAGMVGTAAVCWLWVLEPALVRVQYWQAELPRLQTLASEVEAVLQDATAVRPTVSRQERRELPAALIESLDVGRLQGTYELAPLEVDATSQSAAVQWQVQFAQAPIDALVPWLLSAPHSLNLALARVTLTRADGAPPTPPGLTIVPRHPPRSTSTPMTVSVSETTAPVAADRFTGVVVLGKNPNR